MYLWPNQQAHDVYASTSICLLGSTLILFIPSGHMTLIRRGLDIMCPLGCLLISCLLQGKCWHCCYFTSRTNFMLSWDEHAKGCFVLGPDFRDVHAYLLSLKHRILLHLCFCVLLEPLRGKELFMTFSTILLSEALVPVFEIFNSWVIKKARGDDSS